jgi:hypothetical protein
MYDMVVSVTLDMNLQPNIGSDRSWVYSCPADVSKGEPTPETLAVQFRNSNSTFLIPVMPNHLTKPPIISRSE